MLRHSTDPMDPRRTTAQRESSAEPGVPGHTAASSSVSRYVLRVRPSFVRLPRTELSAGQAYERGEGLHAR